MWRFKVYESEDGINQPRDWYQQQSRAVKAAFDGQLFQLSLRKDAPEAVSFRVPGYGEVIGIAFEIDAPEVPDGVINVLAAGFWQKDSSNFVILLFCEETAGDHDPPLYLALELRKACDSGKGRIHEHTRTDEPYD
jgi:hypothetical protein